MQVGGVAVKERRRHKSWELFDWLDTAHAGGAECALARRLNSHNSRRPRHGCRLYGECEDLGGRVQRWSMSIVCGSAECVAQGSSGLSW